MSINGKNKLRTSNQDYMNLLYSDSDSDKVPDLKLPPVKGKKLRRKRSKSPGNQDESCCSVGTVLKLIMYTFIFGTLTVLTAISFWSVRQIQELQDQIELFESSEKGETSKTSSDMMKMQSQMVTLNATILSMKAGLEDLQKMNQIVISMQRELEELKSNARLSAESQGPGDLDKKFKELTGVVAVLGSNVTEVKTASKAFEGRLTALEASVRAIQASPTQMPSVQNLGSLLSEPVNDLQGVSVLAELKSLKESLNSHQEKLTQLESMVKLQSTTSTTGVDKEALETLVTKAVDEKVANLSGASINAKDIAADHEELANLTQQFSAALEEMKKNTGNQVDVGDFLAFKKDTLANFEQVNGTFFTLNGELEELSSHMGAIYSAIQNISSEVSAIKKTVNVPILIKPPDVTPAHTEAPAANTGPTESPASEKQTDKPPMMSEAPTHIHLEGIDSLEDLHNAFANKWATKEGQLDLSKMVDPDKANALRKYDVDGNGLYSESELEAALGFQTSPDNPPIR